MSYGIRSSCLHSLQWLGLVCGSTHQRGITMFTELDRQLLIAFLCRDFSDFRMPEERQTAWIDFRIARIEEALKERKADYIKVQTLTNMGQLSKELVLSAPNDYWDWKEGDLVVTLCACGKDEHWGGVSRTKYSTSLGIVAMMPELEEERE